MMKPLLRVLIAVAGVVVATGLLIAGDANLTVASLVYVAVVVLASLLGYVPGAAAAIAGYLALNYWFTPAYESFRITSVDDVVPLLTFALTAAVLGGTIARVNVLHHRAREHEQEAFEARVEASLNESRAGFLAAMTHNLKTPLASIKAASSTLRSHPELVPGNMHEQLLDTVYFEADRLDRLVVKVLELSRIRAGALEPELEAADIGDLVRSAMHRLRNLRPDVTMLLDERPDVVVAEVDVAMLELVVVVLLENALRFAPRGSEVRAVVRAEPCRSASAPVVTLCVVDEGPGVSAADQERIFHEFERGDSTGTGLGLTIARAICEAHGGSIAVESRAGAGAAFEVRIPAGAGAR
jgi:two-component system, OmpR family, sensor histidine kinase KdpD